MLLLTHFTKTCSKCKDTKTLDMFNKDNKAKFGIRSECKKCRKEYCLINKNNINSFHRDYYSLNKYKINERAKYYRNTYKEKHIDKNRKYYLLNKDKLKEKSKIYNQTLKGKFVNINSSHKRRTKTNQGDVTSEQLMMLQQNSRVCYWCNTSLKNKTLHIDHYIPLSKGGEHTLSNLVASCPKCNLTKNAKDPIQFANSIGKLL